jgi:hypothetical protein
LELSVVAARLAARLSARGEERLLLLEEVEALLASRALVVDGCRHVGRDARTVVSLARRPVLFALARALGEAWVDGELWHATWEGDASDLRRVDPRTGEVLERLEMPPGVTVSGLESDGGDRFFCGGGTSGKVRAVRRPRRGK